MHQSCPTLCDPIDGSPTGLSVPEILQARILEWVATSFSNACKWKVKVKLLSCVRLLVTPWTAAHQAPPYMGFSRQEYWSGMPLSSPLKGDLAAAAYIFYSKIIVLLSLRWSLRTLQYSVHKVGSALFPKVFVYITANICVQLIMHFVHKLIE